MDNLEFETLTAEEFDEYLKNHKEKDYLLIDVCQESEYEQGHMRALARSISKCHE